MLTLTLISTCRLIEAGRVGLFCFPFVAVLAYTRGWTERFAATLAHTREDEPSGLWRHWHPYVRMGASGLWRHWHTREDGGELTSVSTLEFSFNAMAR